MGISASALALSRPFTFGDGKKVDIAPIDYEGCARFSLWLEERSLAGMARASALVGDNKSWMNAHLENISSGRYEVGSTVFTDATSTDAGFRKILELMIDSPDAEAISWDIVSDDKDFAAAQVLVLELNKDPKAKRLRRIPDLTEKKK